jgi:hypothetical protein
LGMSETLRRAQTLVLSGNYRVSDHGFNELEEDAIIAGEAIAGIAAATAIEDYPIDRAARVFLPCNTMEVAALFTSCGRYPVASVARRY